MPIILRCYRLMCMEAVVTKEPAASASVSLNNVCLEMGLGNRSADWIGLT